MNVTLNWSLPNASQSKGWILGNYHTPTAEHDWAVSSWIAYVGGWIGCIPGLIAGWIIGVVVSIFRATINVINSFLSESKQFWKGANWTDSDNVSLLYVGKGLFGVIGRILAGLQRLIGYIVGGLLGIVGAIFWNTLLSLITGFGSAMNVFLALDTKEYNREGREFLCCVEFGPDLYHGN
jgi:hypothetical protein